MNNSRNRFLIINLVLLVAFILCLVAVIIVYQFTNQTLPAPTPSATPIPSATVTPSASATITLTPTASNTPRPSATPTITLTPTWTVPATSTPTPTGPATLIALQPAIDSGIYSLEDWEAADADRLVALMEYYPESLTEAERGTDDRAYYAAFSYAIVAYREALLRFPEATQAEKWRWSLAYDMARVGDTQAGRQYGDLIAAGLNSGAADIENLYTWFQEQEPRLSLHMVAQTPPSGYIGSYIIELRGPGSAFIWLLQSSSAFRSFNLLTNFDFVLAPEAGWIVAELNTNPDDGEEVAIYFSNPPGTHSLQAPRVFSIGQIPAKELAFIPNQDIFDPGIEFTNYWAIRPNSDGGNDLVFQTKILPTCPLSVRRYYRWNGAIFEYQSSEYSLESLPFNLSYCQYSLDHAAKALGPQAAIAIMDSLTPDWPPPRDLEGNPYPLDALDEWRYRLGIYHALLGEEQSATGYFKQIRDTPTNKLSRWIDPATKFLEIYKKTGDIYRACQLSSYCDTRVAIKYLVANMPGDTDALGYLQASGVSSNASGYFDFDGDEAPERWFTMRPRPLEGLELWILAAHKGGVQAIFVDTVATSIPTLEVLAADYISAEALRLQPVTYLDSRLAFSMRRRPQDSLAYLVNIPFRQTYPDRFQEKVDSYKNSLFNRGAPNLVQKNFEYLVDFPGLVCQGLWTCDEYYYLLGLASELAGDESSAVQAYHKLWSDYSRSPYTTMARLKLVGGEKPPTPTKAPSATPTATLAVTNTLAGTTTPQSSATITPTSQFSPTSTTTGSGAASTATPTPTPTPTATSQATQAPPTNTLIPSNTPYP